MLLLFVVFYIINIMISKYIVFHMSQMSDNIDKEPPLFVLRFVGPAFPKVKNFLPTVMRFATVGDSWVIH